MFSEKNVEEYGDTPFQHGCDVAKLDHLMPGGEEGRSQTKSVADQDGSYSGVVAPLEVNPANCWWGEDNMCANLTLEVPSWGDSY